MMTTSIALPPVPERSLRQASMADLMTLLIQQHRQKIDIVIPTSTLRLNGGALEVAGIDALVTEEGVTDLSGLYRPTWKVDGDLADLFKIPVKYVRRLRDEHVGLLDTNVNEWAGRATGRVLLRLFYGSDPEYPGTVGIARAILSDRYGIRDNLDTAVAVLDGMRAAGLDATDIVQSASLSDDNLYLYVEAPEVQAMAPTLLAGYRSPYNHGTDLPIVHAGFVVKNSETGDGALSVTPRLVVQICRNGMVMKKDAMRQVHLSGRLPEGQIEWSADTQRQANELVKLQMRDAVTSFLTEQYVTNAIAELEATAGVPVEDVEDTLTVVSKRLAYTEAETAGILNHFIRGGQVTAGGVLQAVTSFSQRIESVDRQNEVESSGVEAMRLAAAHARR